VILTPSYQYSFTESQVGFSRESDIIRAIEGELKEHLFDKTFSFGWRACLEQKILEMFTSCTKPGWDGYSASPITERAKQAAITAINLLPDGVEIPDVVPEPSGEFALEWNPKKKLALSITCAPDRFIYAAILGTNKFHGEGLNYGVLPEEIQGILSRYFFLPGPPQ